MKKSIMTMLALAIGATAAFAEHGLIRKIIKAMDGNGDGKVQKDEWWWGDEFAGYDKDSDGALDAGELARIPKAGDQRKFKSKTKKAKKS